MPDILKDAMNACFFQMPLKADDPRRVDLHRLGVRGTDKDPIVRMQTVIETADTPTPQLFSGFLGSGKSTELNRLAANLTSAGYVVALTDCEEYLNLNVPPQLADLLAVVAASTDTVLKENCGGLIPDAFKSYWQRFRDFLVWRWSLRE